MFRSCGREDTYLIGVINLMRRNPYQPFTEKQMGLATTFAEQAA